MINSSQSEISRILIQLQRDDVDHPEAANRLFEVVYGELHRLASDMMYGERTDHTLQPTALVHELYMRLVDSKKLRWESRAHFFGTAARAMRRILVDHARRRGAAKREGGWNRVTLDRVLDLHTAPDIRILHLEEVLNEISEMDDRMARVVELRVFAGMKVNEVAHVLDVSPRTVDNDWSVARMWITRMLAEGGKS